MKYIFGWVTLALMCLCFQRAVTDESNGDDVVSDLPVAAGEVVEELDVEDESATEENNARMLAQPETLMVGDEETASADKTYSAYRVHRPNNQPYDCHVGYNVIPHGSVGSISPRNPCWKKLCWNGELLDREDGCYFNSQCYNLNSYFEFDCVTYSCTKSITAPHSFRYSVQSVQQKCRDASGRCRETSERNYSGYINGRYYTNCECRSGGFTVCYSSHNFP